MVNPTLVRIGGASAAQTRNRYQGTPSSERSTPKTSQATASSKGATPLRATAATVFLAMAVFFRITSILPLFAGPGKAEQWAHVRGPLPPSSGRSVALRRQHRGGRQPC